MRVVWGFRVVLLGLVYVCDMGAQTAAKVPAASVAVPKQFQITGVVVSSVDGSPVPHSHLTATLTGRGSASGHQFPAPLGPFDGDEHGRFTISLPSAGAWYLSAVARGYTRQALDEHEGFSSSVVLTVESPTSDVRFRISPEAVIAGVVLDEAGEPVRKAQVSLLTVPELSPDRSPTPPTTRAMNLTDDRGMYEFDGLPPGNYRVTVAAQPWYAVSAQPRRFGIADIPPPDPVLDVVYPVTWFPGVDDPALAETLTLHGGDTRQADFHMIPIPSMHLRIIPPVNANPTQGGRQAPPLFPMVQRVTPGVGRQNFVAVSVSTNAQGQMDVGGLEPGLYTVRLQGSGDDGKSALVEVTPGSSRTIDLNAASTEANVTIHLDGLAESDAEGVQVNLIDSDGGGGAFHSYGGGRGGDFRRRQRGDTPPERTIQVPPGRYEVTLAGKPYLTGITGKGAEVSGRYVTVPAGDSALTLHVADAAATLTGFATLEGKPSVGALVLLVPATLDSPNSIPLLRRDQSNSDGSFDIADVIPGQYILIAIDHGWDINWRDASTLRHYLAHGVPLDLRASANVKQKIETQAP
jgi:Carboxypeptidase regulatory-like domain